MALTEPTEMDYAYLAGAVDSDGCIYIDRFVDRRVGRNMAYALRLKIAQTDPEIVLWVAGRFGGSYRAYDGTKSYARRYKNHMMYIWQINNQKAADLIFRTRPYLKIKTRQADLACAFMATRFDNAAVGRKGGFSKIPEELIRAKDDIACRMRDANQRRYISAVGEE